MEALALRLSGLDAYVDGAIRIVAFYDTLMRRRVDLPALARSSAGLAGCVAGVRLHGAGRVVRVAPDGRPASEPPRPASATAPITLDEEEIGTVWLERPGPPNPLDDVLLERLALAAASVAERYGPARTTMADPALVELVISADSDEAARARALRLLGFAADQPVRVVAVRSRLPLDQIGGLVCPARPVKAAQLADVGVILLTATPTAIDPARFPAGVLAGIGAAQSPDRCWREARTALRFATPAGRSSGTTRWGRWRCSPRCPRTPRGTTPTWPRSPGSPGARQIWRPWTPTAPPGRCAGPPTCCTCTTAASPAGSNRSEGPWAST